MKFPGHQQVKTCVALVIIFNLQLFIAGQAWGEGKPKKAPASASLKECESTLSGIPENNGSRAARATVETDWTGKVVVLDTNVLLTNPNSIFDFPRARIILSINVIEEIDKKKQPRPENMSVARNAREVTRVLDRILGQYAGRGAVTLTNGSTLEIDVQDRTEALKEAANKKAFDGLALDKAVMDNKILASAFHANHENPDRVWLISQDLNAQLKAKALGVHADDYTPGFSRAAIDAIYSGFAELDVSAKLYRRLLEGGEISLSTLKQDLASINSSALDSLLLNPNQFVIFRNHEIESSSEPDENGLNAVVGRYIAIHDGIKILPAVHDLRLPVRPRNLEQRMLVDLLFDPEVHFVFLLGKAGTGKTLLTLMAGMEQTQEAGALYNQMVLIRPMTVVGEDPGALPGGQDEKVEPFLAAYKDNLNFLLSKGAGTRSSQSQGGPNTNPDQARSFEREDRPRNQEYDGARRAGNNKYQGYNNTRRNYDDGGNRRDNRPNGGAGSGGGSRRTMTADAYMGSGKVVIQLMAYIRGRTLVDKYVVIDEAQNLDVGQLKTLVTRAGEGSKFIIMGDVGQIDKPFLNMYNNGLADLVARLEDEWTSARDQGRLNENGYGYGYGLAGVVRLIKGERSKGAEFMTKLYEGQRE